MIVCDSLSLSALQLGPDSLQNLRKLAETMSAKPGAAGAEAAGDDDEDDMPDLVDNFEDVSESS